MTHKTLGEMTDAEIGALVRAFKSGKMLEYHRYFSSSTWAPCSSYPEWDLRTAYRIAPEPIRQAVIPWDVFTDDIVAVAKHEVGDWIAYTQRPECGFEFWQGGREGFCINRIKFDRGNEPDWRNTLQMRPVYEVE